MGTTTLLASLFERALQCHRAGRTSEAQALYEKVLGEDPEHHVALYSLSTLALQAGQTHAAADLLTRAIELAPDNATYHTNLGEIRRRLGLYEAAAESLDRALALKPDLAEARYNLAVVLEESKELDPAIESYERAADLKPDACAFQRALAHALLGRGDLERAAGHFACASVLSPRSFDVLGVLATTLGLLCRPAGAAAAARRALALKPDFAVAHHILGAALMEQLRVGDALSSFRRAVEIDPGFAAARTSLAQALAVSGEGVPAIEPQPRPPPQGTSARMASKKTRDLRNKAIDRAREHERAGRVPSAVAAYRQALEIDPDDEVALHSLGRLALRSNEAHTAAEWLARAVARAPMNAETQVDLGEAYRRLGRHREAVDALMRALSLEPDRADASHYLGLARAQLGEPGASFAHLERAAEVQPDVFAFQYELAKALRERGAFERAVAHCHCALAISPRRVDVLVELAAVLRRLGRLDGAVATCRRALAIEPDSAPALAHLGAALADQWHIDEANDRGPDRRLRIGYVSADFYEHSAAYFLEPLMSHHDHERFEIHCYSSTARADAITDRLRRHADVWHDIERLGDPSAAELVRQDQIDVLVDLAMHTGRGRPRLFACKPAPVQVCWLAYAGTTGLETMDYRITDPFLDPPDLGAGEYSESSLVLPETFWCYDPLGSEREPGSLPALRAGHVTFGCQNSFHKVNPGVLELWARVLLAVEDSRLIMHAPEHAHARVLEGLARHGVARDRVELVPRRRRLEYLKTYEQIDIGLDTVPFNGATTSLDAYWMGVPVVTLVGSTVVGRAGRCLAMNLGLPELVANSRDEFERAAVRLARDLGRLGQLRSELRDRMRASPLMDAPRFARNLEAAYRKAWRAWCDAPTARATASEPSFESRT